MGWLFDEWFFDGITQKDIDRFCREMVLLENFKKEKENFKKEKECGEPEQN